MDIGADESDGALWPSGSRVLIRVSPLGDDANDGSSWILAKRRVQAAINAATPTGGQIWMAAGSYVENVTVPIGIALYGGFAGTETELSQRDWTANETILDGNKTGRVVTMRGAALRLDGFTIRNGNPGGIYCYSCSPTIANNTITGNANAGIHFYASSVPTITNNITAFSPSGVFTTNLSTAPFRCNCAFGNAYNHQGLANPTGTNGNISKDPQFVRTPSPGPDGKWGTADDDLGDWRLAAGSVCINAGDPAYVPTAGETDMDGQPRKGEGCIDIGADEFWWRGDANYDGYVNVGDLQVLVAAWGSGPDYTGPEDINNDGFVNVGDLQVLVSNWGISLN